MTRNRLQSWGKRIFGHTTVVKTQVVMDPEFLKIYRKCKKCTIVPIERSYALYKAVKYIHEADIPGDIVECGVWRGGSSMIIAYTLLLLKDTTRKIWLYDTYTGMTEPAIDDVRTADNIPAQTLINQWRKKHRKGWYAAGLDEVKSNMRRTRYPEYKLAFVAGPVERTLQRHTPKRIALLRLDTDWYSSTKIEMEHLYPLLAKKGVILVDDYGYWKGSKKAVDGYFKNRKIPIMLQHVDHSGVIGVKI
jgi:O-methyltransferase